VQITEEILNKEGDIEKYKSFILTANWTPDWRWSRARYLEDNKLPSSKTRDDDLIDICRFFIKTRKSGSERKIEKLRDKSPNLFLATEIHEDTRNPLRWVLEGALLTAAGAEEIGEFLCLHPNVVAIYENLFFNVRPFMGGQGFIYSYVLVPSFRRATVEQDLDLVFKSIAYACGWDTFKLYCSRSALDENSSNKIDEMVISELKKTAYQASLQRQINVYNSGEIIEQYLNIRRIDMAASLLPFAPNNKNEQALKDILSGQEFKRLEANIEIDQGAIIEPRALDVMKQSKE
jgi:hypothetical protein